MAREDWRDREDRREDRRFRDEPRGDARERDDFGLADYSESYAYDPGRRAGYRTEDDYRDLDDYGQADYSRDYAYDRRGRSAARRYAEDEAGDERDYADREARREDLDERREPRSWMDRAEAFFTGHPHRHRYDARPRRRGPSDRVLWAVIMERLEAQRGLDLRDVDVAVHDGEVTLNGTVRRKLDKRRIEDIADIDGIDNVQNNLRVRDRGHWTFI